MDDLHVKQLFEKLDRLIELASPHSLVPLIKEDEAEREEGCTHQDVETSDAPQGSLTRCNDCGEVVGRSKHRKK
jgi:hypothetical protein